MKSIKLKAKLPFVVTALYAIISAHNVYAAEPEIPESGDEAKSTQEEIFEVINVTVNRRVQNINETPASITAFSQAVMDRQGVRDVSDIAALTPGLNFVTQSQFTGSNAQIAIRGISSSVGAATTGIYIDDLAIQSRSVGFGTSNTYPRIFDLDRIEVLRGPQGTLFGAGSQGGAVRFITPKPSLTDYSVYSRADFSTTLGGDTSYELGVAVGVPVIEDELGFRFSAWHRKDGGWIDSVNFETNEIIKENANTQESSAFRLSAIYAPSDSIEITPSIFYQKENIDDTGAFWESLSDSDNNDYRQGYAKPQTVDDEFVLPALNISIDLGNMEFVSVTSYFKRKSKERRDYTIFNSELLGGPAYPIFDDQVASGYLNDTQEIFTQEVRLQSSGDTDLQWVTGIYYSDDSHESTQLNQDSFYDPMLTEFYGITLADIGLTILPGDILYNSITNSDTTQLALYGQIDYSITEKLILTAGLRYSDIEVKHYQFIEGPWAGAEPSTVEETSNENPLTPKFGLSYQATQDNLVYSSISKGFRPGGAQTQMPVDLCSEDLAGLGIDESPTSYDSDSLLSYEVGSKNTMFDGRVQFNASVFHIKWDNIQTFVEAPSCGSGFIENTGSLTSNGFDFSLQGQLTDNFRVGLVMGYNDATFDETVYGGAGVLLVEKGDEAKFGPKLSMTLTGNYFYEVFDYPAYLRFDYSRAGKESHANPLVFGINPENTPAPSYTSLNMRLGLEIEDIELALYINNMTNAHPGLGRVQINPGSDLITNATLRPRTIGLTMAYRY